MAVSYSVKQLNKNHVLLIFDMVLLSVLASCESSITENTPIRRHIDIDSLIVCETMDELPYSVRFIKLDTYADCVLGDIKKIEADGTNIFIEDFKERVFRFDKEGRFLNKIGSKGGAASEYISLFDFCLDKKNQTICMMDVSKGKLLRYDYNGKFLLSQDIDTELMSGAVGMTLVNENDMIAINCNGPGEVNQYSLINLHEATSEHILPYAIIGEYRSVQENGKTAQNSSYAYALSFLSDTIYSYSDGKLAGEFLFQPKEPHFEGKYVKGKTFHTCYDAENFIINQSVSAGIKSLYATDDYLFFTYTKKENYYRVFFNSAANKGYIYDVRKNLEDVGNIVWNNVMTSTNQYFVGVMPVGEYISNKSLKEKYPAFSELLSSSGISDNPIITFIEIQQEFPHGII